MKKSIAFASRNLKELIRDPLMSVFSVGFPVIVLLLLTAIQANIPVDLFTIDKLAPGIAVFGLTFISLFAGILISKDKSTSFLARLFAAPLTAADFLLGYMLPLLPISIGQSVIVFVLAFFLGLPVSLNVLLTLVILLPTALLFIGLGMIMGTLVNDKAVGGLASILTNVAAWLSGIWFDVNLVGKTFKDICYLLPFAHAVDAARAAMAADFSAIMPHLWWVIGYAVVSILLAILFFKKKMSAGNL